MDTTTFAQKIKEKYPAYQNIDDATLTAKFIEKYPVYKSVVKTESFGSKVADIFTGSTQAFGKTAGEVLAAGKNIEDYNKAAQESSDLELSLTKRISELKKAGQDTSRLETALIGLQEARPKLEQFTNVESITPKQVAGQALGTALEATSGGVLEAGGKTALSKSASLLQKIKSNAALGGAYGAAGGLSQGLQDNASAGQIAKDVATGAVLGSAIGSAIPLATESIGTITKYATPAIKNTFTKGKDIVMKAAEKVTPESETIMNRVARLDPTDAQKFEKLAGKSHGKYLQETGNFGTPDEIVTKESEKFLASKQSVDDALAQLPGKYQAPEITKVYDEVIEKLQKTESPEANKWISLRSEYDKSGFDMSTINELKRVYEREVKLGYNKLNNPDAVKLATNRDNALRNWQTKQADILGFENIAELNKQTQLAKFIVDNLGKKIIKQSGLNGMSLTDWIMLSGGDPTAIGGLLTKKLFSDPGVQSRIAKMLSKVEPQGMIKPKIGETKLPRLEAGKTQTPNVSGGSTIQVAPKGANVEFTGQVPGVIPEKPSQPLLKGKSVKKASVSKASTKSGKKSKDLSTPNLEIVKKDNGTFFKISSNQTKGELNAVLRDGKLKIINVSIDPKNQGKGIGKSFYKSIIAKADELGVPLVSDSTVSKKASNVYESLIKDGYNFKKNPRTKVLDDGELFVEDGRKITTPVYTYNLPK